MLKIESYITPLILSYVDRYIKNIKPEDSQVSLWGGEAVFNNLDLRLEVLEAELASPFRITSGHIHELKIYVPWTKLASEPIVITINTIECSLKLKNDESDGTSESSYSKKDKRKSRKQEVVAPPSYVQSLVNRIINNIVVEFNNVIFKFVDKDIVLSLNAPKISFKAADSDWKAAFTDVGAPDFISRKLLTVTDLTICLDKRNALGKIELYQEPLLYRCSLEARVMTQHKSLTSSESLLNRIEILCSKLDFSLTDTQLPMFLRLLDLTRALYNGYFKEKIEELEEREDGDDDGEHELDDGSQQSWAGWAWSYVPPLNPFGYGGEEPNSLLDEGPSTRRKRIFNFGVYVDQVTFTLKTTFKPNWFVNLDHLFQTTVKRADSSLVTSRVRFVPHTLAKLSGFFMDSCILGVENVGVRMGISGISIEPTNACPCGFNSVEHPYVYSSPIHNPKSYLQGSLFDPDALEKIYSSNWEERLLQEEEEEMLKRSPFLTMDFIYSLSLPEEFPDDRLSTLDTDLEYSDYPERATCRLFMGPTNTRVTPGLLHRVQLLVHSLRKYDYLPYLSPTVTEPDRVDSDLSFVPLRKYEVKMQRPKLSICIFPLHRIVNQIGAEYNDLTVELEFGDVLIGQVVPMYPRRLVRFLASCSVSSEDLVELCYSKTHLSVSLEASVKHGGQTSRFLNTTARLEMSSLLDSELWPDCPLPTQSQKATLDKVNLTLSLPKCLLLNHLVWYLVSPEHSAETFASVAYDAFTLDPTADLYIRGFQASLQETSEVAKYTVTVQDIALVQGDSKIFSTTGIVTQPFVDVQVVVGSVVENLLMVRVSEFNIVLSQNTLLLWDYVPKEAIPVVSVALQSESSTNPNSTRVRLNSGRSVTDNQTLNSSFFQLSVDSGMCFDVRPVPTMVRFLNWLKLVSSFAYDIEISSGLVVIDEFAVVKLPSIIGRTETRVEAATTAAFPMNVVVTGLTIVARSEELLAPCQVKCLVTASESTSSEDSGCGSKSLSICIHADFEPVSISLSVPKIEATIFALGMLLKLVDLVLAIDLEGEKKRKPITSSALSDVTEISSLTGEVSKFSVWAQIALPKIVATLDVADKNLTVELEDLSTSFDYQDQYFKVKSKVGSCIAWEVCRAKKSKAYILGMAPRMDETAKPSSFFVVTFTMAEIESFRSKIESQEDEMPKLDMTKEKYICELDIQIEQFDVKLSKDVLESFKRIGTILLALNIPSGITRLTTSSSDNKTAKPLGMAINGSVLPLIYLQSCGARFYLTLPGSDFDTILLQASEVAITPQVDNKVSRYPILRPDLFEYATKMKLLDIPGSELEDRQYRVTFTGVSVSLCPSKDVSLQFLGSTQNENPALRWNKLEEAQTGSKGESHLKPLITNTDICVIYAPAIVHFAKSERPVESLVCGHSLDVYITNPIAVYASLESIALLVQIAELIPPSASATNTSGSPGSDVTPLNCYCTFAEIEMHAFEEASGNLFCYTRLLQPHALFNMHHNTDKFEVSVYDAEVSLGGSISPGEVPTPKKYGVSLLETRTGQPVESTGVNPSLFTLQLVDMMKNKNSAKISFGKPVKIKANQKIYDHLLKIQSLLSASEPTPEPSPGILNPSRKMVLDTSQIVIELASSSGVVVQFGLEQSSATLIPRNGAGSNVNSFELMAKVDFCSVKINSKALLEPVSFHSDVSLTVTDCGAILGAEGALDVHKMTVQVRADDLAAGLRVLAEVNEMMKDGERGEKKVKKKEEEREVVTYVDDLRAGPFQFLPGGGIEDDTASLTSILPYQVAAFESCSALVWRYPQPRALARVDIYPLPIQEPSFSGSTESATFVSCVLQYWSAASRRFKTYQRFSLSELKTMKLDLPSVSDRRNCAVSPIWRVVLNLNDDDDDVRSGNKIIIKPEALLCCMRVDSCYDSDALPKFTFSVNCEDVSVNVNAQITTEEAVPSFVISLKKISASHTDWGTESRNELLGHASLNVVDFRYLTFQNVISPFPLEVTLFSGALSHTTDLTVAVRGNIDCRAGQSTLHTFNHLKASLKGSIQDPTPFEIHNCTYDVLRIGQIDTEESISLAANAQMPYSWRSQRYKPDLRLANEASKWAWSQPFSLEKEKSVVVLGKGTQHEVLFWITVKDEGGICKKVTIQGQLQLSSLLSDSLELSLIPSPICLELQKIRVHMPLTGKRSSLVLNMDKMQGFHIRLSDRVKGGGVWSGQVPLTGPRAKEALLIKVPHSEKEKFATIWCHFIREKNTGRMLLLFAPLYMVRSHLPGNLFVHVKTGSLNSTEKVEVGGKGVLSHLEPPGTIDHTHQLSFKIGPEYPESPSISLSWGMVQHQKLPWEVSSFSGFLDELEPPNSWPYVDLVDRNISWGETDQPNVDVNVSFVNLRPLCNTLLLDIRPWGLFVNQTQIDLQLQPSDLEPSEPNLLIRKGCVIALPTLSASFTISCEKPPLWISELLGTDFPGFRSETLQLSDSDRNFSPFRPKMSGIVPMNGFARISLRNGEVYFDIVLQCRKVNDIIVISAVNAIATTNTVSGLVISDEIGGPEPFFARNRSSHYLSFKLCSGLSTPVELSGGASSGYYEDSFVFDPKRLCRTVPLCGKGGVATFPVVVGVGEKFGVTTVHVAEDRAWMMLLVNKTKETLMIAEMEERNEDLAAAVVFPGTAVHFSPQGFVSRFPEVFNQPYAKKLVFACTAEGGVSEWSQPIELVSSYDQFVCIPKRIDLKVHLAIRNGKHVVQIEPISRLEVSASEIRKRLKNKDLKENIPSLAMSPSPSPSALPPVTDSLILCRSTETADESQADVNPQTEPHTCSFSHYHDACVKLMTSDTSTKHLFVSAFLKQLTFTLLDDVTHGLPIRKEIVSVTANHVVACLRPTNTLDQQVLFCLEDLKVDNQFYSDAEMNFSWPVVFCRKELSLRSRKIMELPIEQVIAHIRRNSFVELNVTLHSDCSLRFIDFRIDDFTSMLEDSFYYRLKDILKTFAAGTTGGLEPNYPLDDQEWISLVSQSQPLSLERIKIHRVSGTISVRAAVKIYVALDHTPINFNEFEKKDILSTSYHLGQAFSMHCLSSILFKAGWMVGSLEIIGSPTLLFKRYTTGLKDFVKLPYQGVFKGPRGFLAGVVSGSMSLISHITGGTLLSVTQVADNIARNLDRLTLDAEHIGLREEGLRRRPKDLTEGLSQGLSEFGLSLLGAIGGLAHHPLKSLMDGGGASGVAAGMTKGAIGLVTKPLGGAASFVASTGRGLLAGSYDTDELQPRREPFTEEIRSESSTEMKIRRKLGNTLLLRESSQLYLFDAMRLTSREVYVPLILVVTEEVIVFHNAEEDIPQAVLNLSDLSCESDAEDPTLVYLALKPKVEPPVINIYGCPHNAKFYYDAVNSNLNTNTAFQWPVIRSRKLIYTLPLKDA